jgi:hypothetical protein
MARPTKLTPEVQDKIIQALRGGNFRYIAARWAGIDISQFKRWMSRGKQGEAMYRRFRAAVLEAEKSAELRAVALVMKAAQEDAKHAEWWLERKFPQRWGRKERHELTGARGGPIHHQQSDLPVELLANPELRELLDSAAALVSQLSAPPRANEQIEVPATTKTKT